MNHADLNRPSSVQPPLLMKADEVARLVAISTRTLWRLVGAGQFPSPIRVGGSTRWRLADVQGWVSARHSNVEKFIEPTTQKGSQPLKS
jgi:excisionase family DNA binding protein